MTIDGIVGGEGFVAPLVLYTINVGIAVLAIPDLHEGSRARVVGSRRRNRRALYTERAGADGGDVGDEGEFVEDEVAVEIIELAGYKNVCPA